MSDNKSVQVAVRVRPFNQREKDLDSKLCVKMVGNKTTLLDLEDPSNNRDFVFDYSFWSHDGYSVQADGMFVAEEDYYADQDKVYNALGADLLENAWKGYHCTLFAYGQTGSGKSYSVMGYKPNVGIVPITCKKIFEKIQSDSKGQYEVTFSMMEIYNEKLQDLLIPISKRPSNGMKVRESPSLGFYAEGLRKYPVKSFEQIEERMEEGSRNRSVAATQMNATSSRAHTIVLIEMKQKTVIDGRNIERFSAMNLVDLAGSEKTDKTGATGDRLKEASAINKSLSMLGLVISTLADHAIGKTKAKIPYRDSVLTKILKNALGGNSKTIMICALSPAQDNYEETLSTLRYADQAKKIKNSAIVNESASDKLIRELKAENTRLNNIVNDLQIKLQNGNFGNGDGNTEELKQQLQALKDLQENMIANQKLMENENKSEEQKLKELEEQDAKEREEQINNNQIDKGKPYLTNLNEDSLLNFQLNYQVSNEKTTVGRKPKQGDPQPDIMIQGLGVKSHHCDIINEDGKLFIIPGNEPGISSNLFVNGEKVTQKTEIFNNDRVIIGQNATFLAKIPNGQIRDGTDSKLKEEDLDFSGQTKGVQIQNLKEKHARDNWQEYQDTNQLARCCNFRYQQNDEHNKQQITDLNNDISEANQKKLDLLKEKKEFEDKYNKDRQQLNAQKFLQKIKAAQEKRKLEQELAQMVPKVNEMNLLADEMERKINFLVQVKHDEEEKIKVLVQNRENNTNYTWDQQKAMDRYYKMLDKLDELYANGHIVRNNNSDDPFWDFADPIQGGRGTLELNPLLYKQDIPLEVMLFDKNKLKVVGLLKVHLYETDRNGESNLAEIARSQDSPIQDPESLIGKHMFIKVVINSAKLPRNIFNTYVEYKLFGKTFKTEINTQNGSPVFYNYAKVHHLKNIDDFTLFNMAQSHINFTVYGQINPNEDPAFLGKKDDKLTFQIVDGQQNKNIQIKNDPLRGLWTRRKQYSIILLVVISWILYMAQLIVASDLRKSYDALTDIEENIADEGDDHYSFWRSFSVMLISCAVMMTYYIISFVVNKCLNDYTLEFIQLSILPAFIWFISSIVFLSVDQGYQGHISDIHNSKKDGALCDPDRKDYKDSKDLCDFSKRYVSLVDLTIYMLIFNTIIFLVYYYAVIKYVKANKEVINQKKMAILSSYNNENNNNNYNNYKNKNISLNGQFVQNQDDEMNEVAVDEKSHQKLSAPLE